MGKGQPNHDKNQKMTSPRETQSFRYIPSPLVVKSPVPIAPHNLFHSQADLLDAKMDRYAFNIESLMLELNVQAQDNKRRDRQINELISENRELKASLTKTKEDLAVLRFDLSNKAIMQGVDNLWFGLGDGAQWDEEYLDMTNADTIITQTSDVMPPVPFPATHLQQMETNWEDARKLWNIDTTFYSKSLAKGGQ